MGRYINMSFASGRQPLPTDLLEPSIGGVSLAAGGFMGYFGGGRSYYWSVPGSHTFVVPPYISQIRVRVLGAGGGGNGGTGISIAQGTGGGGGGFAMGVFNVSPGAAFAVTVGLGGRGGRLGTAALPTAGGSSSFGALLTATGGQAGVLASGSHPDVLGGSGVGGDFTASGGSVIAPNGRGGAGAGSQLGNGGSAYSTGGAGLVYDSMNSFGSSAFGPALILLNPTRNTWGPNIFGKMVITGALGEPDIGFPMRFPFEFFKGSGGYSSVSTGPDDGGSGAGGARRSGVGGDGGDGGGGGSGFGPAGIAGGTGGYGGGGGGTAGNDDNTLGGPGGGGLVIVEW